MISLCTLGTLAIATQDRFTVKALNGVAFSERRGYETWPDVEVSQTEAGIKAILEIPGIERMGICPVLVSFTVCYLHTLRERQLIREYRLLPVPHNCKGTRLHFHGIPAEVSG